MNLFLKFLLFNKKNTSPKKNKTRHERALERTEKLNGPSMYDKMPNLISNQKVIRNQ